MIGFVRVQPAYYLIEGLSRRPALGGRSVPIGLRFSPLEAAVTSLASVINQCSV
ncbi:hypothetical protein ES703_50092 [subsurface metagenome]